MLEKIQTLKATKVRPKPEPKTDQTKSTSETKHVTPTKYKPPGQKPTGRYFLISFLIIALIGLTYFFIVKYPQIRVANRLKEAKSHLSDNEFSEALEELKSVLDIEPTNVEAWELTGSINLTLNKGHEAVKAYKRALDIKPNVSSYSWSLAEAYYVSGSFESAEKQYALVAKNPSFASESHYMIGLCRVSRNKVDKAIESFQKSIELNPDNAEAHFEIAKLVKDIEAPELAETEFLIAIEKDAKFVDAYEGLGDFYMVLDKADQAVEIYNQPLIWLKPSNADQSKLVSRFRSKLGRAYYEIEEYERALEQFDKVLLIDPNMEVYRDLGRAYYKMDKAHQAVKAWQKALEFNPDNIDIHYRLGTVHHKMGDLKSAVEEYRNVVNLDATHVQAYRNLGFVYFQQYDYNSAKLAWEHCLKLDPEQKLVKRKLEELARM